MFGAHYLLGHHFFENQSPVFALDQLSQSPYPLAVVSKAAESVAPVSSFDGLSKEGALKWLLLKDSTQGSQGGIDTVYRVKTAGGNKPGTCTGQKATFEVLYSAQCKSPHGHAQYSDR